MEDICQDFADFCRRFDTEQACADALFQARWPDGFRCPSCADSRYYRISTRRLPLYECAHCGLQTSIIAGTAMEGSSTSLTRWFQALFLLSQPSGISSLRLSKIIGVTYKTAWLISHKLRHAMQRADASESLTGTVRVQPFHYGSLFFLDSRQPLILGASVNEQNEPTHVKIKQPHPNHVDNEQRSVLRFGLDAFEKDHTDGQQVTHHTRADKSLPVFKRLQWFVGAWLNDTFNGIGAKHLQAYLDEFAFRVNLKLRSVPAFDALLGWCASTPTIIYKELTKDRPVLPVPWRMWGSRSKWRGRHLSLWTA
ncbi:hypothetical protein J19TS2_01750 [Cohnella xylanilytica]|uniref:IS1595 family transposase n=1 Tax=Cohnella xylanilytica TaxID=557555 RepID=A0A841U036_9BACL|nr:transposase [Cohnella xylanilytica]MBB6692558.1 IS1595 family transposase [Cohnella xylanilytica]GIO10620.1 hypothetical protein J19TS2_01750 [Cohnella xylanilytica]